MTEAATGERLLIATRRFVKDRGGDGDEIQLDDAVCQDLLIFGIDVDDYVAILELEFGPVVGTIPWLHYTDQTLCSRGCRACVIAPFLIPWILFKKLAFGPESLPRADPRNYPHRLTLRQVAEAIDAGGWSEDYWP
jgi:hypothetical protein